MTVIRNLLKQTVIQLIDKLLNNALISLGNCQSHTEEGQLGPVDSTINCSPESAPTVSSLKQLLHTTLESIDNIFSGFQSDCASPNSDTQVDLEVLMK